MPTKEEIRALCEGLNEDNDAAIDLIRVLCDELGADLVVARVADYLDSPVNSDGEPINVHEIDKIGAQLLREALAKGEQ